MENPVKMDDLGVPLFLETPICKSIFSLFYLFSRIQLPHLRTPAASVTVPKKTGNYGTNVGGFKPTTLRIMGSQVPGGWEIPDPCVIHIQTPQIRRVKWFLG